MLGRQKHLKLVLPLPKSCYQAVNFRIARLCGDSGLARYFVETWQQVRLGYNWMFWLVS